MERTAERTAKKQGEMDAFHGRKEETPDASNAEGSSVSEDGAGGGTRTHTALSDHQSLNLTRLPISPFGHNDSYSHEPLSRIILIIYFLLD